jgi:hypothetical protein
VLRTSAWEAETGRGDHPGYAPSTTEVGSSRLSRGLTEEPEETSRTTRSPGWGGIDPDLSDLCHAPAALVHPRDHEERFRKPGCENLVFRLTAARRGGLPGTLPGRKPPSLGHGAQAPDSRGRDRRYSRGLRGLGHVIRPRAGISRQAIHLHPQSRLDGVRAGMCGQPSVVRRSVEARGDVAGLVVPARTVRAARAAHWQLGLRSGLLRAMDDLAGGPGAARPGRARGHRALHRWTAHAVSASERACYQLFVGAGFPRGLPGSLRDRGAGSPTRRVGPRASTAPSRRQADHQPGRDSMSRPRRGLAPGPPRHERTP